jgi:hypothetical protein
MMSRQYDRRRSLSHAWTTLYRSHPLASYYMHTAFSRLVPISPPSFVPSNFQLECHLPGRGLPALDWSREGELMAVQMMPGGQDKARHPSAGASPPLSARMPVHFTQVGEARLALQVLILTPSPRTTQAGARCDLPTRLVSAPCVL